ncbi:MAG: DUF2339 domain-containing protein [Elusimicrobia bacterium]|nr:DUF2339 domain-containing protein [Elusimicrobiota bacterium]
MPLIIIIVIGVIIWLIITISTSSTNAREALTKIELLEKNIKELRSTVILLWNKLNPQDVNKPFMDGEEKVAIPDYIAIPEGSIGLNTETESIPCLKCGSMNSVDALHCMNCGTPTNTPLEEKEDIPIIHPETAVQSLSIPKIDWEKFMGIKLFAWLGGFAFFLGISFFVKYSIEHNLISPLVRVMISFIFGICCIVSGLLLRKKGYSVTVQALCASGVAVLYADIFAACTYYHFISSGVSFLLMILVTITSFLLAVRLDSQYVAILGMIGGFLTPPLLSTGIDRPLGLFTYITILDVGLIAVALQKRWGFLVSMAAVGTLIIETGWVVKFFNSYKVNTGITVFLLFSALFIIAFKISEKIRREDKWINLPASFVPLLSMVFAMYLLSFQELGTRPGLVLSFLFLLQLGISYLAVCRDDFRPTHLYASIFSFIILLVWTNRYLTLTLLPWGLAFYLIFAVLHSLLPIVLQKIRPTTSMPKWCYLFPSLMLILVMFPLIKEPVTSIIIWPFVFLISAVAVMSAMIMAIAWVSGIVLILTMVALGIWTSKLQDISNISEWLVLVTFFILAFFAWGLYIARKKPIKQEEKENKSLWEIKPEQIAQLSSLSAILPFVLVSIAITHLKIYNPSPIFGLVVLLIILLLGLVRYRDTESVGVIAMLCTVMVQYIWHTLYFNPQNPTVALIWYFTFYCIFTAFPFIFMRQMSDRIIPWAVSAFVGPLQFYLIHKVITLSMGTEYIGILPAIFAVLSLLCLFYIIKYTPLENPIRMSQLALFAGVSLFFITLIFPLQFEKQWITIGWALEGIALLWLLRRIPHQGLKIWGVGLLIIAFVRLALNKSVFLYHPREILQIFNWYLYAYGIVTLCLFVGARFIYKLGDQIMEYKMTPVLNSLGTILAFLLLNIEIADYFSTGSTITFQFSGDLARDMTYSLGWTIFALVMLIIGINKKNQAARIGSLGLFSVTIIKVFLHDLWRLGQLYRVGSIIGLAITLTLVSFLYQRYLSPKVKEDSKNV